MSSQIFKRLRKPGYAPTLMAGMLSNIMVFAEPVSRVTTNIGHDSSIAIPYKGAGNQTHDLPSFSGPGEVLSPSIKNEETKVAPVETNPTAIASTAPRLDLNEHAPFEEYFEYPAAEGQGAIGISGEHRSDNARDNYFTVVLPDTLVLSGFTPVLEYALHGLAGATSTTKSVNGSPSYGGAAPVPDDRWKVVEEYLPADLLVPGANEVFFGRRTDTEYRYHIKDLRIKLYLAGHSAPAVVPLRETVEAMIAFDSALESATFTFGAGDASRTPFHGAELLPKNTEGASAAPDVHVWVLPFKDIKPVENDLVNVTAGPYKGFRVGFAEPARDTLRLRLEYDPDAIPEGYSSKDIRTYVYDKNGRRWKALPVEEIDHGANVLVTHINDPGGETDYINGILKAPEHPETAGFAPTMLTDIQFADPTAGVVGIPPPSANQMGSLNTSFPIKLPPGRNGMQPSLEVSYNSDGGNGLMGMGWGLSIPSIALNTKWGVPLFDDEFESEIYSLSGQELVLEDGNYGYTGPHRDIDIGRVTNRQFYLRREGSYLEIIRHGDLPSKYWWEVTDKMGNKSYYGGLGDVDDDAVLSNDQGNIAHWALVRQEDPYGNYVEYDYHKADVSVDGISGQEFYVKSIKYTLHPNANDNHYQIDFTHKSGRQDVMTSARTGFFWITKDLLTHIDINFVEGGAKQRIRSYTFDYKEGLFKKQQLERISELDSKGKLFYSNTMEYYSEVASGVIINLQKETWGGANQNLASPLDNIAPSSLVPSGSALGTEESSGFSAGLRVGVGFGVDATSVSTTIGGSYSYIRNQNNMRINFLDMDGNGLPDKVYTVGGKVYYQPNTGNGFGNPVPVEGINRLERTISNTSGYGVDANALGLLGVGKSWSSTKTETDNYFTDFNGDGLPDLIKNNRVYFNTTQTGSDHTMREFTMNVGLSDNPISAGAIDSSLLDDLHLESKDEIKARHSQFDHVKIWQAPYTGSIAITGSAKLIGKNICNDDPAEPNSFRLTIERGTCGQGPMTVPVGPATTLLSPGPGTPMTANVTNITKGEMLFFRIHNLGYGCGGEVEWNPVVTYTNQGNFPNGLDENGKSFKIFDAADDFILNNGGNWSPGNENATGTVHFNLDPPDFGAYDFSDDIDFNIKKIETNITTGQSAEIASWPIKKTYLHHSGTFDNNGTFSGESLAFNLIPVGDYRYSLRFEVGSRSNVAWDRIEWKPTIVSNGNIVYPPVNYLPYDNNTNQQRYWFNGNGLVSPDINDTIAGDAEKPLMLLEHDLFHTDHSQLLSHQEPFTTKINWVVKEKMGNGRVKELYTKSFYVHGIAFVPPMGWIYKFTKGPHFLSTEIDPNMDIAYFRYILDKGQVKALKNGQGVLYSAFYIDTPVFGVGNGTTMELGLHPDEQQNYTFAPQVYSGAFHSISPAFFGLTHRGWGQFLYNGGGHFVYDDEGNILSQTDFAGPIALDELDCDISGLDQAGIDELDDRINETDPDSISPGPPGALRYAFYVQDSENDRFLNEAIINSAYGLNGQPSPTAVVGRFGESDIYNGYVDPSDLLNGNGTAFIGLKQRSRSQGEAISGTLAVVTGTHSTSGSQVLNQYIDLNGDRYPDLVTGNRIQFTDMRGGLSDIPLVSIGFGTSSTNEDNTVGVSISAIQPNSDQKNGDIPKGSRQPILVNPVNTNEYAGINTSYGSTYDLLQWMDINGDGLPDKVWVYKDRIEAGLNVGYGFLDPVVWGSGYNDLVLSKRNNVGAGATLPLSSSFAMGFGGVGGTANVTATIIDINGDGLPDLIRKSGTGYVYHLNTGTKFETVHNNFFDSSIGTDFSMAGNVFGSFTAGYSFPIFFLIIKITGSPSVGLNASLSEKSVTLQDINGDGLPDVLHKKSGSGNGSVEANLNQVGKTHLLKKVNLPLGGSWEADYARVGNTFEMPQSRWTLHSVSMHDGFTGDNAFDEGQSMALASFAYSDGRYDRRDRDFRGFGEVTTEQLDPTNNSLFRYTVKRYHNSDYYLKGMPKETATYTSGGTMLSIKRYFYNLQEPGTAFTGNFNVRLDDPLVASTVGPLDRTRAFPALVKFISTTLENGQALNQTQEFRKYDQWGNITEFADLGSVTGDTYRAEIAYNDPVHKGPPTEVKVFEGTAGGTLLRHRETAYTSEGKPELATTHLGNGNTAQVELSYDVFGNTIEVRQLDNLDETGTAPFVQAIEYDGSIHTYPTVLNDSYGQSSSAEYDLFFGAPVFVTDMNANSMRTRIDNRGRPIEIAGPNEYHNHANPNDWLIRNHYKGELLVQDQVARMGPNDYRTDNAQGSFAGVAPGTSQPTGSQHHAVTRHKDPLIAGNEFLTVSISDGLGRAIQLKKKHIFGITEAWQVSGKEKKDAFGRTLESYLPTIQTYNPSNINVMYDNSVNGSIPPLVMEYDDRDRPKKITQPGEPLSTTILYGIDSFGGMAYTQVINELAQTQITYTDVRGRQRKVVNNQINTEFFYNSINELIKVKNHAGYETHYAYDLAGRRTKEQHPDRGTTAYTYDNAGRLIEKQTANLMQGGTAKITYGYDHHRLLEINYPQHPQNNVSYVYGESNTSNQDNNIVGRVVEMEDGSGIQRFGYGRLGELIWQQTAMAVAGKKSYWFGTQWRYDSWNRISKITYPDYEVVDYHYDTSGQLLSVTSQISGVSTPDIVTGITYTAYGEREQIIYGNGTVTNYDYDSRRRMDFIDHQFTGFQIEKQYVYDPLSNITDIVTGTVTSPSTGVLGGPVNHTYIYDDYNRLIQAEGHYAGPDDEAQGILKQAYRLDMEYDLAHNIISKQQTHQFGSVGAMGDPLPSNARHAATSYNLAYADYAMGEYFADGQGYVQPHAPRTITEYLPGHSGEPGDPLMKRKTIDYDANGNQTEIREQVSDPEEPLGHREVAVRKNLWDEEDRLMGVDLAPENPADKPLIAAYTYSADGDRRIRYLPGRLDAYYSAKDAGSTDRLEAILYPNSLITVKTLPLPEGLGMDEIDRIPISKYTKHYYIGSERVASALGTVKDLGMLCEQSGFPELALIIRMNDKVDKAGGVLAATYAAFGKDLVLQQPFHYDDQVLLGCDHHDPNLYAAYWYHPDHLGSSSYITNLGGEINQHLEYLPFGETLIEEHLNSNNSPFKFNAKELDAETGNYYYGARYYDPKWSIWLSVDPLAELQPDKTPYHFVSNNPITRIDPTGMLDHEYDKDGNQISNLGGDKIDFHHQANGDTKITDKASGASNIIAGGEALIRGYTQRDNNTSWGTLFSEWDQGTGAEKSMFADFDNTSTGVFGSFDNAFSTYGGMARSAVLSEGKSKGSVEFGYGDINPLTAGSDGWEQFIGRASLSYYKLGDKVLYMMNDSKSMTSFMYRMSPSWDRSDFRLNGNTHQTYIWTETMGEVQQKTQTRLSWNQRIQQSRQEYKNTESQRLPAIKW